MKTHARSDESIADVAAEHAKHYVDVGVDTYNAVAEKTRALPRQVDGYVRSNPWLAIGLAGACGVAIGLWLRRR